MDLHGDLQRFVRIQKIVNLKVRTEYVHERRMCKDLSRYVAISKDKPFARICKASQGFARICKDL